MATMAQRRGGGSMAGILLAGAVLVAALLLAQAPAPSALDLPQGAVDVSNPHAWVRHGLDEVTTVREAMRIRAQENPQFFQQPPCKDGKFRYIVGLADGRYAIWVLQQVAPGRFVEVTAFISSDQGYVKSVRDGCGNDSWLGHALGG
jgi:hypothetical protein